MKDGWTENLTVEVLIDGKLVGSATYGHKKEIAQNRAAKAALDKLKETLGDMSLSAPSPDWNVLWPILSKIVSAVSSFELFLSFYYYVGGRNVKKKKKGHYILVSVYLTLELYTIVSFRINFGLRTFDSFHFCSHTS